MNLCAGMSTSYRDKDEDGSDEDEEAARSGQDPASGEGLSIVFFLNGFFDELPHYYLI